MAKAGGGWWFRNETRSWALFAPAALGAGVALYFAAPVEPAIESGALASLWALVSVFLAWALRGRTALRIMVIALGLFALGFAAAQLRSWSVAAPVWEASEEVALSGRARALERAADGSPRLLIDLIEIEGRAAPRRIRVSFRALAEETTPEEARARLRALLGERITLRARLFAPPGPAEPGAFDYRRRAWFEGVGALGSAKDWPETLGAAPPASLVDAVGGWIEARRRSIGAGARAALPGETGELAAALLVGDRSGLSAGTVDALRAANLAHLLAISGLHMGVVCATVFALMRLLLALPASPPWGVAPKKLAALAALLVGAGYLFLAGATVPTQRAFLMAAVVFGAVLIDRPAITLRAVALAAIVILLLRPESLFDAGFQLSFAATTAMVAAFQGLGGWIRRRRGRGWKARLWGGIASLLIASLVAGLATAPFAALAFNRVAPYGLAANLLAVPALGLVIMPMGLLAVVLTPLGLEDPFYAAMGYGIDYVLLVAGEVAAWPGALAPIAAGPPLALGLLTIGGLFLCLWRGAALRLGGIALLLLALFLWRAAPRPDVLAAERGRLVGVLGPDGRAFDRDPSGRYAAELWLRRDGDAGDAARRRDFLNYEGGALARTARGRRVEIAFGRRLDLDIYCEEAGLLIAPRAELGPPPRRDCLIFDRARLAETGALALYLNEDGAVTLVTAAAAAGRRFWTDREIRADRLAAPARRWN